MTAGFFITLIAAAVATAPAPDPTPASPLREIGHVRAVSAACTAIVVHANSAISTALRNDLVLNRTLLTLRGSDLDTNAISKRNGIQALAKLAADMRENAVHADNEVKKLRELAAQSPDETRKAELKEFADALGGAAYRQKKIAMDLAGFTEYVNYEGMRDDPDLRQMQRVAAPTEAGSAAYYIPKDYGVMPHFDHGTNSFNELASRAAKDFEDRITLITTDEAKAADHTDGITSGC